MLNELLADERTDVRVVGDVVERRIQIGRRRQARRHHDAIQEMLRAGIVIGLRAADDAHHHRIAVVRNPRPERRRENPSGEDAREFLDRRSDRRWGPAGPWPSSCARAVRIEQDQADAEQLQHLARVVFVRLHPGRGIELLVVHHVEIAAHGGVQRDIAQQLPKAAERIGVQQLLIGLHPTGEPHVDARDDEDLSQREGDALAQLVAAEQAHS